MFQALKSTTCPATPTPVSDAHEVYPGWTINRILQVVCYACGGLATLITLALFFLHAFNMRNPSEQIKIMRIILVIPIFAALSMISVVVGQNSILVDPWKDFYEGMALSTFFLLVCTYAGPDRVAHKQYFSGLEVKDKDGSIIEGGGMKQYNKATIAINQYVIVQFFVAIVTVVTQVTGVYCRHSDSIHFAHLWLTIINTISVGIAVTAAIRITMQLRKYMPERPIFKQLLSFKLLIGVNWLQSTVFSLVAGHVTPTDTLSYNDITVGLPNALLCIEMIFFAIFFYFSFSHRVYVNSQTVAYYGISPEDTRLAEARQPIGPFGAILRALNPISIPLAIRELYRANNSMREESDEAEENVGLRAYQGGHSRNNSGNPPAYPGYSGYAGRGM